MKEGVESDRPQFWQRLSHSPFVFISLLSSDVYASLSSTLSSNLLQALVKLPFFLFILFPSFLAARRPEHSIRMVKPSRVDEILARATQTGHKRGVQEMRDESFLI